MENWIDKLEPPRSLTMHPDRPDPLQLVDRETLHERKQAEIDRIEAVRPNGLRVKASDWLDATPERIRQALASGLDAGENDILSPNGFSTGFKYRRIENPIRTALNRGWIRERHYMAGMKFFDDLNASVIHPRVTAQMERVDNSAPGNASDFRLQAQTNLRRAIKALPLPYRDPFFDWAFRSLSEDIFMKDLGRHFSQAIRDDNIAATGKRKLIDILNILAKHYGF